eukprot:TRINITY_DN8937_c0_g1_i2.p1 TRINITY_DN8937_c0_g1~~TRINITY_DN8937_c0_g1_i2.p1  ORF type:complete len:1863 (+),score=257.07 TRINITY_DN8937_c0_g1_i2:953-6541(+)
MVEDTSGKTASSPSTSSGVNVTAAAIAGANAFFITPLDLSKVRSAPSPVPQSASSTASPHRSSAATRSASRCSAASSLDHEEHFRDQVASLAQTFARKKRDFEYEYRIERRALFTHTAALEAALTPIELLEEHEASKRRVTLDLERTERRILQDEIHDEIRVLLSVATRRVQHARSAMSDNGSENDYSRSHEEVGADTYFSHWQKASIEAWRSTAATALDDEIGHSDRSPSTLRNSNTAITLTRGGSGNNGNRLNIPIGGLGTPSPTGYQRRLSRELSLMTSQEQSTSALAYEIARSSLVEETTVTNFESATDTSSFARAAQSTSLIEDGGDARPWSPRMAGSQRSLVVQLARDQLEAEERIQRRRNEEEEGSQRGIIQRKETSDRMAAYAAWRQLIQTALRHFIVEELELREGIVEEEELGRLRLGQDEAWFRSQWELALRHAAGWHDTRAMEEELRREIQVRTPRSRGNGSESPTLLQQLQQQQQQSSSQDSHQQSTTSNVSTFTRSTTTIINGQIQQQQQQQTTVTSAGGGLSGTVSSSSSSANPPTPRSGGSATTIIRLNGTGLGDSGGSGSFAGLSRGGSMSSLDGMSPGSRRSKWGDAVSVEVLQKVERELRQEEEEREEELRSFHEACRTRFEEDEHWQRKQIEDSQLLMWTKLLESAGFAVHQFRTAQEARVASALLKQWTVEEGYWRRNFYDDEEEARRVVMHNFVVDKAKITALLRKRREQTEQLRQDDLLQQALQRQRLHMEEEHWRGVWEDEEMAQRAMFVRMHATWLRDWTVMSTKLHEVDLHRQRLRDQQLRFLQDARLLGASEASQRNAIVQMEDQARQHIRRIYHLYLEEEAGRCQVVQQEAVGWLEIFYFRHADYTQSIIRYVSRLERVHRARLNQLAEDAYTDLLHAFASTRPFVSTPRKPRPVPTPSTAPPSSSQPPSATPPSTLSLVQPSSQHSTPDRLSPVQWASSDWSSPTPRLAMLQSTMQEWEMEESYARGIVWYDERDEWSKILRTEVEQRLGIAEKAARGAVMAFNRLSFLPLRELAAEEAFDRTRISDEESSFWTQRLFRFSTEHSELTAKNHKEQLLLDHLQWTSRQTPSPHPKEPRAKKSVPVRNQRTRVTEHAATATTGTAGNQPSQSHATVQRDTRGQAPQQPTQRQQHGGHSPQYLSAHAHHQAQHTAAKATTGRPSGGPGPTSQSTTITTTIGRGLRAVVRTASPPRQTRQQAAPQDRRNNQRSTAAQVATLFDWDQEINPAVTDAGTDSHTSAEGSPSLANSGSQVDLNSSGTPLQFAMLHSGNRDLEWRLQRLQWEHEEEYARLHFITKPESLERSYIRHQFYAEAPPSPRRPFATLSASFPLAPSSSAGLSPSASSGSPSSSALRASPPLVSETNAEEVQRKTVRYERDLSTCSLATALGSQLGQSPPASPVRRPPLRAPRPINGRAGSLSNAPSEAGAAQRSRSAPRRDDFSRGSEFRETQTRSRSVPPVRSPRAEDAACQSDSVETSFSHAAMEDFEAQVTTPQPSHKDSCCGPCCSCGHIGEARRRELVQQRLAKTTKTKRTETRSERNQRWDKELVSWRASGRESGNFGQNLQSSPQQSYVSRADVSTALFSPTAYSSVNAFGFDATAAYGVAGSSALALPPPPPPPLPSSPMQTSFAGGAFTPFPSPSWSAGAAEMSTAHFGVAMSPGIAVGPMGGGLGPPMGVLTMGGMSGQMAGVAAGALMAPPSAGMSFGSPSVGMYGDSSAYYAGAGSLGGSAMSYDAMAGMSAMSSGYSGMGAGIGMSSGYSGGMGWSGAAGMGASAFGGGGSAMSMEYVAMSGGMHSSALTAATATTTTTTSSTVAAASSGHSHGFNCTCSCHNG